MPICSIEGCETKSRTKGLCNKHALRLRVTGTTDEGPKAHAAPEVRFWRRVTKTDTCWIWNGSSSKQGYGRFQIDGKGGPHLLAHRFSYTMHNGDIPDGMVVMHKCDNPSCVNPDHLGIGTYKDNMADMRAKGRDRPTGVKGEENPRSKLTEEIVRFIRANPQMGHKEIADMHGLSPNAIRGVRIGRTWRHVT